MSRISLLLAILVIVAAISQQPASAQDIERTTLYTSAPDLIDRLPDAPGNTVAVVASIRLEDGTGVVAVVRNGTDQTVTGVSVSHDQKDMSGTPATVSTPSTTAGSTTGTPTSPSTIPPSGLALALVLLGSPVDGATDPVFTTTTDSDDDDRMDLAIPYAVIEDGTLSGSVTAVAIDAAFDPEIVAVCVGPDGELTGAAHADLTPRRIDPYRTIPLRLPLPAGCDAVLATASAHR